MKPQIVKYRVTDTFGTLELESVINAVVVCGDHDRALVVHPHVRGSANVPSNSSIMSDSGAAVFFQSTPIVLSCSSAVAEFDRGTLPAPERDASR